MPLLALVLTACGGSSPTDPCQGLPTARHSAAPLVLFGALRKLDKRALCAHFGRPTSTRHLPDELEVWKYDNARFLLQGGHVISYRQ